MILGYHILQVVLRNFKFKNFSRLIKFVKKLKEFYIFTFTVKYLRFILVLFVNGTFNKILRNACVI